MQVLKIDLRGFLNTLFLIAGMQLCGCASLEPFERFASGFESPSWRTSWNEQYLEHTVGIQGVDDRRFGFEPARDGAGGRALRVTIEKGTNAGTHQLEYQFRERGFEDPAAATCRYLMRFGSDFVPEQGGKLPGFAGTYGVAGWGARVSNGSNGWSTRSMFYPAPKGVPVRVASLCYLANMTERSGRSVFYDWHTRGVPRFERNRWYEIVQHVRMNTIVDGKGQADGVLQVWVDGVLAVDERSLVFRHAGELRIDRMWFNVHYGGETAPSDMHIFFDDIVIERGDRGMPRLGNPQIGKSEGQLIR